MKVKRGNATKVVNTEEVDREDGIDTVTYTVRFRIDTQQIKFESHERPRIRENDNVCVAGSGDAGVFRAYAYKNFTTGASGEEIQGVGNGNGAILFVALFTSAIAAGAFFLVPDAGAIAVAVSLIFVMALLYFLRRIIQISKASRLLKLQRYRPPIE